MSHNTEAEHYVSVAELEQDLIHVTGNKAIAKVHAQQYAIMYRGNIIDAVKYQRGLISQDDLHLSRRVRWQHSKDHSKKLCENMQAAGRGARPNNVSAHHIVAWSAVRASRARLRLAAFGIDIDHEANGVYLPRWQCHVPMECMPDASSHSGIHTPQYYLNVEFLLEQTIAEGLGHRGIINALRDIGEDLQEGVFPIREQLTERV